MIGPGDVGWYSDDGDHDRDEDDDDNNNEDNQMSRVELKTKSELVKKETRIWPSQLDKWRKIIMYI